MIYLDDLNVKQEDGSRSNVAAHLAVSVGDLGRECELPLVAFHHELHGLRPALDDLVGSESGWLSTLVRRVEFLALDGGAAVVAVAGSGGQGAGAGARTRVEHFVLEAGVEDRPAVLLGVLFEVRASFRGGASRGKGHCAGQQEGSKELHCARCRSRKV